MAGAEGVDTFLKKLSGSNPSLKDFVDGKIEKGESHSNDQVDVYSVTSALQDIAASHCLQIKYSQDDKSKSRLAREYNGACYLESAIPGHTDNAICLPSNCLILSCQSGYKNLWEEITESRVDAVAIQQLAKTLARLHKSTIEAQSERDADLSEQLHADLFVHPYSYTDGSAQAVAMCKRLTHDNAKTALDQLANILSNKHESFIHGDLGAYNVTVKQGHPKLVNLGCSAVGPRSLDLARLLASYMAQYHRHMLTSENNDAHRQVSYKMMDACNTTVDTYLEEMKSVMSEAEVESLISETAGFIAVELIRRSVGGAPYPGLEKNPSTCTEMYESAMRLLPKYDTITDMGRLMMIGLALC